MELLRALGAIVEGPGEAQARLAEAAALPAPPDAAAHTELFRLQLPPYASIYLGAEGMLGGEARDRIAGFWRALGAVPPAEIDHLTTLLAAYASLVDRDGAVAGDTAGPPTPWRTARHAFFREHLASWLPAYLIRARELGAPFYRAWADALGEALAAEAEALGPATSPPAHFAAAPPLADDDLATPEALADALLAPARSGMILTRRDLRAGAERAGTGLRQGERRFALAWLLRHEPAGALAWLAAEAERQAGGWEAAASSPEGSPLRDVLEHWRDRARSTARVLDRAAREVPYPVAEASHA